LHLAIHWRYIIALILILLETSSCSNTISGFQASTAGDGPSVNRFTSVGDLLTIDSVADVQYIGRVFYVDGSNRYAGTLQFMLKKNLTTNAYFSNFTITNWGKFDPALNSESIDFSAGNPNPITGYSYDSASNSFSISDSKIRTASINLNTTGLLANQLSNIGVLFTNDFSVMAGGNDNIAFIVQKNGNLANPVNNSTFTENWLVSNTQITNGTLSKIQDASLVIASTPGQNSLPHGFSATLADGTSITGEGGVPNSTLGIFTLAVYSSDPNAYTIDGMLMISPDKTFILGCDIDNSNNLKNYFIGNKN
jgi:hypothetical protein